MHRSALGSSPRVEHGRPLLSASVHPRVCGEHISSGSSPRCGEHAATPASPVHPRVCGEHFHRTTLYRLIDGRFIPACAGNISQPWFTEHNGPGSSPRVRGTSVALKKVGLPDGSSPRVRGTSDRLLSFDSAYSGSSPRVRGTFMPWTWVQTPVLAAVHPRVCGEHSATLKATLRRFIPACANIDRRFKQIIEESRFIPACAGNIRCPCHSVLDPGSSPRVRGTYLIVTACYSLDYMPCKIATDDLTPDSPTPHMPRTYFTQAKKIRVEDRQNPQVSGGLCQRFQTQTPRHWGRPKQSQHHRRR